MLLVNLGTPEKPTAPAVKKFLGQFLHDRRVIDLTRWIWCPVLHGIVLPFRSPKVAKLYQSIWLDDGSPLMVHCRRQREKLEKSLGKPVALGMTYGEPSVKAALDSLLSQGIEELTILPLYPQYSSSTSASVFDSVARAFRSLRVIPSVKFIRSYHSEPSYIKALACSVTDCWALFGKGDYLLCSYHGIPKRYAELGDIYPKHCEETTALLKKELGLGEDKIGMSYQSRFGREEWLTPYTDETLDALPSKGIKNLYVITPAFSVDCLETLEEIAEQGKISFLESGGEQYHLVPCLNESEEHITMMCELIKGMMGN